MQTSKIETNERILLFGLFFENSLSKEELFTSLSIALDGLRTDHGV